MTTLIEIFSHDGLGAPYAGTYDPWLVGLSVVVASLASLAALSIAPRIGDARSWRSRWAWTGAGAFSMGGGVWAMHFVGMLAFSLPCSVTYDVFGTVISVIPSVFASAVALWFVGSIDCIPPWRKLVGAILIGGGIGAMHYAGMAAMRPDAFVRYSFVYFALSVVVAVLLAYAAIQVFAFVRRRFASEFEASCVAAPVMGLAIAGMHYTAMQASTFYPIPFSDDLAGGYEASTPFAILVATGSVFVGVIGVVASVAGRQWQLSASLAAEVQRRKGLEREAEARRARLQSIFDAVADAIVTIDRHGRIQQWSAGAERVFGYMPDEVVGRCLTHLMPEPHRSRHAAYVDQFLTSGVAKIIGKGRELTGLRKDGTAFPLELNVSQVNDGDEIFFTGIMRDITERKAAEAALVTAREEAEAANLAKSQFLATMSHEIRTPINGVLGMASLLTSTPLNARQQRLLGNISRSGMALLGIINNILDLAKIEAGKFELAETTFSLREVIDDLSDLFAERCEQKGVELIYYVDENLPHDIVGDPTRLRQVLTNLAGNAVKFTEHGEILIEVALQARRGDDLTLRCSVRDTGIGIAPEDVGRVFDSFHQVDSSLTRSRGGTGLGLSITRLLVELMGGEISVESELGAGSTFTFTAALRAGAGTEASEMRETSAWSELRILLVERNPVSSGILQSYLAGWGVDAVAASSLEEAEAVFARSLAGGARFRALAVDAKGFGDAALAFAERCRSADAGVSIIALTSLDRYAADDTLARKGFAAILPKPVSASDLFNALAPIATGQRQAPAPAQAVVPIRGAPLDRRVLVVEDNVVNQEVSVGMLEHLGCRWTTASDGQRAVELAAAEPFDAILMDCEMPIMDGLEATRRIRRREAATADPAAGAPTRIPIIALTAHALSEIRDECFAAGMDDFLPKPFSEPQLAQALSRWLPPARQAAETAPPAPRPDATAEPATPPGLEPAAEDGPLDAAVVAELRARDKPGRPSRFAKLVGQFADISRSLLADIVDGLDENDLDRVWKAAHSLKSSAGAMGARQLAARCAAIEAAGREQRAAALPELCAALERDIDLATTALAEAAALERRAG